MNELIDLVENGKGLFLPASCIDEISESESLKLEAIHFYREYVARNMPLVIRGGCKHWKSHKLWRDGNSGKTNRKYLMERMDGMKISVAKTSNGLADAVVDGKFILPFEDCTGDLEQFFDDLDNAEHVSYVQKQNSSLQTEFSPLLQDVEELEWAREAFGLDPDAVNMWIGDSKSTSSLHKDPYENVYCTVVGEKHFTLLAPIDTPFLYREEFQVWQTTKDFQIEPVQPSLTIPWVPVDPVSPDLSKYPLFKHATPYHVTLKAGDVLYLPSLWYHKVNQSDDTIAVNFWYDMKYNAN